MQVSLGVIQAQIYHGLTAIGLFTPAAGDLVLGTGAVESTYSVVEQAGGGPALGYWQMEPATYADCWENWIAARPSIGAGLLRLAGITEPVPPVEMLEDHPAYAAAMCRVRYARVRAPLPPLGAIPAYAAYWKMWYNTLYGAGTPEAFISAWEHTIAPTYRGWDDVAKSFNTL